MNKAKDLIKAFELHYSTTDRRLSYTRYQANEIIERYAWITSDYAPVLYEAVVTRHPTSLRSLPDLAVLAEAERELGNRPAIFQKPAEEREDQKLLEGETAKILSAIENANETKNPNAIRDPEGLKREKRRAEKGDSTLYRLWWIECLEAGEGYKPMPEDYAERHPGVRKW